VTPGGRRNREQANCDRGTGLAALAAAVLLFLAGRYRRPTRATPPVKEAAPAPPVPTERTPLGEAFHWFTWPVRKEDQAKRRLEESAPQAPEQPKDTSKKLNIGCVTLTCGEAANGSVEDAEKPAKKDEGPSGLTSIVLKVLGTIATSIGVAGAVAVVGAAIFWARFDALGLPATQAVSVIPKAELLVQGGQEVIIFILIGLAAALLITLADPKGIVTRGTVFVLCAFVVIAVIYAVTTSLHPGFVLGLAGLAIVLALLCVGIAFSTEKRLLPLLVSVFLASLIFSSSCALLIVEKQEYAQAIAIRFAVGDGTTKGLTGVYVTATDSTIFFARIGPTDDSKMTIDSTGLYEVHRADTTTYAVGPLEPTEGPGDTDPVAERAKALLKRLKEDAKSSKPTTANKKKAGGATKKTAKATAGK